MQWPIEARRCFNKGLDRGSKSGLYFLSWFVSKEEFFTIPLKKSGKAVNIAVSAGDALGPPTEVSPRLRVWVLLGYGAGDNAQVLRLAEAPSKRSEFATTGSTGARTCC
jgi:hypothetical protein